MNLIDTHCHLYDKEAFPDPAAVVDEALNAGVKRLVVIGIDDETSRQALELADRFPCVYATVGWHPNHAAEYDRAKLSELERLAKHPRCLAIGEIGFDFYWDHATPEQQEACLRDQLALADALQKPTVFHCRKAYTSLLALVAENPLPNMIFHCFSGTDDEAARILSWGGYLGVDGPLTYPKAEALRASFASFPRDRVLIETDAPYMSPHPHRGERNKPAWVALVNAELARIWGVSEEECGDITTANAERAYRLN